MKNTLRLVSFSLLLMSSLFAASQPLPPYDVYIGGSLIGCTPSSFVNVQSVQGTQPVIDVNIPLNSDCSFDTVLLMESPSGYLMFSFPCQGMIEIVNMDYSIGFLDSAWVFVTLMCNTPVVDCEGVPGGSALPGSACDDNNPATVSDTWSADCICMGVDTMALEDCLGIPGGTAWPLTPCDDNNPETNYDYWTFDCICVGIDTTAIEDCLGVPGGSATPGTACDDNDPNTINDMWTADCVCAGIPVVPGECLADFWVIQAYDIDTIWGNPGSADSTVILPIPNEIWVWNLSTGNGQYNFFWDFGDGTSSTEAFPTHFYADGGPYELCLTITEGTGCTDTYCDSVGVDDDGIFQGMIMHPEYMSANRSGFTLNVVSQQPLAVESPKLISAVSMWPNPAREMFNLTVTAQRPAQMNLSIIDMNGRIVKQSFEILNTGNNNIEVEVNDLLPGMYMLSLGNGVHNATRRFVKQ